MFLLGKYVNEIRIYPINSIDCPTEEYAKMCILNGFENYTSFYNLGNSTSYLDLFTKTLFLFQYGGQVIAKAMVHLERKSWYTDYYTDEIEVLDEPITAKEIKEIWKEFKKFNSAAQKIPTKCLMPILELFDKKKKTLKVRLGENESFLLDSTEGKKIAYYVTKYERNPKYRELAIKIHGLTCQICGFNFEEKYGELGKGYIEVHHKNPLFSLDEEIVPNPETDMICVCSNCHRMLHRHRNTITTFEELVEIIKNNNQL